MARSALGLGWSMFKTMVAFKCHQAGFFFEDVTTRAFLCCEVMPCSILKERAGHETRGWTCSDCGALGVRNMNAGGSITRR